MDSQRVGMSFGRNLLLICSFIVLMGCSEPQLPSEPLTIYLISSETLRADPTFALSNSDLVVTEDHIIHYDWEEQTFLLSEVLMSSYKDSDLRFGGHFTLTLGDMTILTGQAMSMMSPMRVDGPIMYVPDFFDNDPINGLEIHLADGDDSDHWSNDDPSRLFPSDDPKIVEAVYARLEKAGKLK
ncbi:MAG: hypothetical protein ACPG8W_07385 [Candidatus Promineifilaceae bacterium]